MHRALGCCASILSLFLLGCQPSSNNAPAAPPAEPVLSAQQLALQPVVSDGLDQPLFLTHTNDDSNRLFVLEQAGRIRIIEGGQLLPTPFLDVSSQVSAGGERGLLGLAFHPDYRTNGRYFINYTRAGDGATVIAEYRVSDNPRQSQIQERQLLVVPQPYANHNGGMLAFGPDGNLYIALGDGGSAGDPENRAQNPQQLLGKILRIDVNQGEPYAIPPDNPFAATGGRPEIFALGLRNPWRFSFDRQTGQLWTGDVGQNAWEEIDVIQRGSNYGWRIMEGRHCFSPATGCDTAGLTPPVAEYLHDNGRCSVTGGYVYRGGQIPSLRGQYLFADFCSGEVFRLSQDQPEKLLSTGLQIASFGEDQQGELYVIDLGGTVHRLVAGQGA